MVFQLSWSLFFKLSELLVWPDIRPERDQCEYRVWSTSGTKCNFLRVWSECDIEVELYFPRVWFLYLSLKMADWPRHWTGICFVREYLVELDSDREKRKASLSRSKFLKVRHVQWIPPSDLLHALFYTSEVWEVCRCWKPHSECKTWNNCLSEPCVCSYEWRS